MAIAGWYADPEDASRMRWWDGVRWTTWVGLDGRTWDSPLRGQAAASDVSAANPVVGGADPAAAVPPVFVPSPPVPAYPVAGRPAPASEPFKSVKGLSIALLVLFIVAAAGYGITAITFFARSSTVADLRDGGDVALSDLVEADDNVSGAAGFTVLVVIAIFVLLVIWLWRAYSNTRLFGAAPWRWGRGWAVGGWFIPFANFVIPKSLFNDTWRGADQRAQGNERWRKLPVAGIVTVWWVSFVVGHLLLQGVSSLYDPDRMTSDELVGTDVAAGVVALFCLGASVLGAIAIHVLTRRQHERAAQLGVG